MNTGWALTGTAHVRIHAIHRPVRVKSGPTTDVNGRADGTGADVGGARRDTCSRALFPVIGNEEAFVHNRLAIYIGAFTFN